VPVLPMNCNDFKSLKKELKV